MRPLRLGFSTPRRDCRVAFGRFSRPVDCDDFDTLCGSGRSGVLPFLHRADLRLRSSVSLLRSGAFGSAVVQESAANFSVTSLLGQCRWDRAQRWTWFSTPPPMFRRGG